MPTHFTNYLADYIAHIVPDHYCYQHWYYD